MKFPILLLAMLVSFGSLARADDLLAEVKRMEEKADANLNRAFQKLIREIRAEHAADKPRAELILARLREAQRAWLRFRDAQVVFIATYSDIGSASARAAGAASYGVGLTEQRIKDLEQVPNPF